jgi:hypothetical protein
MKTSIKTVVSLISSDFIANSFPAVVREVTGDNFDNPDYSLTQADADAIAAKLDSWHGQIDKIESVPGAAAMALFGEVIPDVNAYRDDLRSANYKACDQAKKLFQVCGICNPWSWGV